MAKKTTSPAKADHYPPAQTSLKVKDYRALVKMALREDEIDRDVSTFSIYTEPGQARAKIIAKETGILCGRQIAEYVFRRVDRRCAIRFLKNDGEPVKPKEKVAEIEGDIRSILRSERVALNFLGMLSGISSRTAEISARLAPMGITLLDTRKTLPGFRRLSKYAVTMGGGRNHRKTLAEMGLIKENHIARAGGVAAAISAFRSHAPGVPCQVEIVSLSQLKTALPVRPDLILLDNMTTAQLKKCTAEIRAFNAAHGTSITVEASGGFHEGNLNLLRGTGVDYVSMGAITQKIRPLDLSLLVEN